MLLDCAANLFLREALRQEQLVERFHLFNLKHHLHLLLVDHLSAGALLNRHDCGILLLLHFADVLQRDFLRKHGLACVSKLELRLNLLDHLGLLRIKLILEGGVLLNVLHAHGVNLLGQRALLESELCHAYRLGADLELALTDLLIVFVKFLLFNELATSSNMILLIKLP